MRKNDGSAVALFDIGHSPTLDFQELLSSERLCAISHCFSSLEQDARAAEGQWSRLTGPFVERVSELVGHSRSHSDPLNRCAERNDDLAAAGRDSVSELALVVWGQGAMGESASLTQRCALGSRLRFHRLDRLGRLCLLHSFFEPPVPLVFIPLHHGLHSGDPRRRCSSSYVVSARTQLLRASHARCAYAAADSVSGILRA